MAYRFSLVFLLLASVALMMLGKIDAVLMDGLRMRVTDAVAPILDAFSRPAATAADVVADVQELTRVRLENERLRLENAALLQYEQISHQLRAENLSLRALLNYRPDGEHSYITARIIADNSGAFVRSVAVNVGARDGVTDGQAVLGGRGLVGRVVQAGERSARLLLLTDLNARIPVLVERTRDRAILGGDNSELPRLEYLPPEAEVVPGDRIVTSGHGGIFPPGLSVGTVVAVEDKLIRVQLFEDLDRLEYVRIVQFEPTGEPGRMARAMDLLE